MNEKKPLKTIDAKTCTYDELYEFCERMRNLKAKDCIVDPLQVHKVGFWYGEKLPLWVCEKNGRDFKQLLEVYAANKRRLGLPNSRFHTINARILELRAEFNEKLRDIITDDLAIDHEMEHEWDVEDDTPF